MSQIKITTIRCSRSERAWFCYLQMYFTLSLFTCSLLHCIHAAVRVNDARFVYNKSKMDAGVSGEDTDTNVKLLDENETDPIPMDFYRKLNNITEISEFIEKFIDPESIDPQLGIQENLKRPVERSTAIRAKPANCMPESTVVDLKPDNPKSNYYPQCTRVKRCSGCCNTQWMSCQPTSTEIINYQVYGYCRAPLHTKLCYLQVVPVEQHLACKCDCRKKAEDCNSSQIFRDCSCHCADENAREECTNLEHKIWDNEKCSCVCKQNENCTTGTYFDMNQCKCLLLTARPGSKSGNISDDDIVYNRRKYIVKAIEVEADNSTIYKV